MKTKWIVYRMKILSTPEGPRFIEDVRFEFPTELEAIPFCLGAQSVSNDDPPSGIYYTEPVGKAA